MTEQGRNTLAIIQGALAPLDEETRLAVLDALEMQNAKALIIVLKQLDDAREQTDEWRRHNEQRLEEVYTVRKLIGAQPNETLRMAIERIMAPWLE